MKGRVRVRERGISYVSTNSLPNGHNSQAEAGVDRSLEFVPGLAQGWLGPRRLNCLVLLCTAR